jgi:hypothetical protein
LVVANDRAPPFCKSFNQENPVTGQIELATIVRTLFAAGYQVKDAVRQPTHIEIVADRIDELDTSVSYLVAVTDSASYTEDQLTELRHVAKEGSSRLVLVASEAGTNTFSVEELLTRLGGPIPSWRALSLDYVDRLTALSRNTLPLGETGEAWRLFEEAVSDGLEFLFARRVKRLGGTKRGARVADCICHSGDDAVVLVDAKASASGFDAANENLRALKEYVAQQKRVQQGRQPLTSCLIVSSSFEQDPPRLQQTGLEFLAETGVPVSFLSSTVLGEMISLVTTHGVRQRSAIRWKQVFGMPGLLKIDSVRAELNQVIQLQMGRS